MNGSLIILELFSNNLFLRQEISEAIYYFFFLCWEHLIIVEDQERKRWDFEMKVIERLTADKLDEIAKTMMARWKDYRERERDGKEEFHGI